ncbi:recombinase family protein [Kibdelosporangium philippinense]|uniref:Recombinase family protein n=1 Tax=Kibdelosporangium philippinense TaxID=211113 RepID=A0ABS8ZMR2_9PSEU|nr:recombinase family protein [Kibdelosporangium philippinense]MCE7009034.1 recombinase family protein [Kibdelosporangium philippinense]
MGTAPRREWGRTLIKHDPEQLVWALSARESRTVTKGGPDEKGKVDYQLSDLRKFVQGIGGRVGLEVQEPNVSSFKRQRVLLPDGTYGYRVVRPDWEAIMTALRRGECNALAAVDIDRATRDPRILEDLIDAVELYGVYAVSMTGNIDLSTDEGISSARRLVGQRNDESRNTSRRITNGKRLAALEGKHNGGPLRPYGWRKDRLHVNKREMKNIRDALPRIFAGVSSLTIAAEWNERGIATVTGAQWRASTIRNMFLRPRMCGMVIYHEDVMRDEDGVPVRGRWEPILSDEEYEKVVEQWAPAEKGEESRLGGKGRGYRTIHLLSPFVRCGKCNARMVCTNDKIHGTEHRRRRYKCPSRGQGGCGGVSRVAEPIEHYIKALVIADHQRISAVKMKELPPWPKEKELQDLEGRISESTRQYEAGTYPAEHYFPSLARMEAKKADLRREKSKYSKESNLRSSTVTNLESLWDSPSFSTEQKQAAIAKSLTAIVIHPAGKGARHFHPDQITVVFHQES